MQYVSLPLLQLGPVQHAWISPSCAPGLLVDGHPYFQSFYLSFSWSSPCSVQQTCPEPLASVSPFRALLGFYPVVVASTPTNKSENKVSGSESLILHQELGCIIVLITCTLYYNVSRSSGLLTWLCGNEAF